MGVGFGAVVLVQAGHIWTLPASQRRPVSSKETPTVEQDLFDHTLGSGILTKLFMFSFPVS